MTIALLLVHLVTVAVVAGLGWTVNLDHPVAWSVMGLVVVSALAVAGLALLGDLDLRGFYGWKYELD